MTREALAQSAWSRCVSPGVVFHSDRGIEFANFDFRKQLSDLGMVQSMNRPGRMNDNAHMESFFQSMKCEELYGKKVRHGAAAAQHLGKLHQLLQRSTAALSAAILAACGLREPNAGGVQCQLNRSKFPRIGSAPQGVWTSLRCAAHCRPVPVNSNVRAHECPGEDLLRASRPRFSDSVVPHRAAGRRGHARWLADRRVHGCTQRLGNVRADVDRSSARGNMAQPEPVSNQQERLALMQAWVFLPIQDANDPKLVFRSNRLVNSDAEVASTPTLDAS